MDLPSNQTDDIPVSGSWQGRGAELSVWQWRQRGRDQHQPRLQQRVSQHVSPATSGPGHVVTVHVSSSGESKQCQVWESSSSQYPWSHWLRLLIKSEDKPKIFQQSVSGEIILFPVPAQISNLSPSLALEFSDSVTNQWFSSNICIWVVNTYYTWTFAMCKINAKPLFLDLTLYSKSCKLKNVSKKQFDFSPFSLVFMFLFRKFCHTEHTPCKNYVIFTQCNMYSSWIYQQ